MDQIVFEFSARPFWGIVLIFGLFIASAAVFALLPRSDTKSPLPKLQQTFGFKALPTPLFVGVALLWTTLAGLLFIGLLWQIWAVISYAVFPVTETLLDWRLSLVKLTALTATFGAVIAFPFTIIRLSLTRKQTKTASEGLITDRITKAVERLGAEKTIKDTEGERTVPDPEVRIGAIYALERIAQDSSRDHIQIMEILCAYIRENAPARGVGDIPTEIVTVNLPSLGTENSNRKRTHHYERATDVPPPRLDIQIAIEVIGRRNKFQIDIERAATSHSEDFGYRLNLSWTCLRGISIRNGNFQHATFERSRLEQATFCASKRGAMTSNLTGAVFRNANLNGTAFIASDLSGADFNGTKCEKAIFQGSNLQNSNFVHVTFVGSNLVAADLEGAMLHGAKFYDVIAQQTNFSGADLSQTTFGRGTSLNGANFRGAAVRNSDLSQLHVQPQQLSQMFGDASVILPGAVGPSLPSWPKNWAKRKLSQAAFHKRWHAYQVSLGQKPITPE